MPFVKFGALHVVSLRFLFFRLHHPELAVLVPPARPSGRGLPVLHLVDHLSGPGKTSWRNDAVSVGSEVACFYISNRRNIEKRGNT